MNTQQIKAINDAISFLAMVTTEKTSPKSFEASRTNVMLQLEDAGVDEYIYEHMWIVTNQIKPYVTK